MPKNNINKVLKQRGNRYGSFKDNAEFTQKLKDLFRSHPNWDNLSADKKEAIDMTAHKQSRIMNGDPEYKDSWTDIVGYNKLVEDTLDD